MADFGLTPNGFIVKRQSDIMLEMTDSLKTAFGQNINLASSSVLGQIVGIVSEREALVWEAMEAVYNSQYPDTSEGVALDNVAALTGIEREKATSSTVSTQLFFGTPGTIIPLGSLFSVVGNPTAQFSSDAAVTLIAGTDAQQSISFSATPNAGSTRFSHNDSQTSLLSSTTTAAQFQTALRLLPTLGAVTVSGSFGSGFTVVFAGDPNAGKQEQPNLVAVNNTLTAASIPVVVTVSTTVPGVPQGQTSLTAVATGPTQALTRTLTNIDTPVSGLSTTLNFVDALVGRNVETDTAFRIRRSETLQEFGQATVDAIRSKVLTLDGVLDCIIFENITMVTDGDGVPPKAYETVVNGGDQQTIIQTLWNTKPAGIYTHGNISGSAIDSMGQLQPIRFSRPVDLLIYMILNLTVNGDFPVTGQALVLDALLAYGDTLRVGTDLIIVPTLTCVLDEIPGIIGAEFLVGIAPTPTQSLNITVTNRQLAKFDSSRITINVA